MNKKLSYQEPYLELTSYCNVDVMTISTQQEDENVGNLPNWEIVL